MLTLVFNTEKVGKQKRALPSNPPMPKDEMKEPDSDEKKNNRRKKKAAAVLNYGPPKREAMRFSRNLGASSECDDACDVLSGSCSFDNTFYSL